MKADSQVRGSKRYPMPFTRLEIAVLSLVDDELKVLLVRRAEAPHAGKWALPGGVLRIDVDSSLDAAARRVMHERLGLELPFLRQLCAEGGPTRDPRAPWALSIVYRALVPAEQVKPSAGKRIEALAWRPVGDAMADRGLAFDHALLVSQAVERTRAEVERLELPAGFLPAQFTLGELQSTCEQLLGRRLDKSSFRRKLADRQLVEIVQGAMKAGANRPAQIYRLRAR
jgi:ADP-ribose pyrophosphatase YjhB (NUDIX family)